MRSLAYIRHTLNTQDETWSKEQDYYDENGPKFVHLIIEYYKKLVKSPYRTELEKKLGTLVFEDIELQLKGFDERIIPYMQQESKLTTAYKKLMASAEFEFDGKKLNLPPCWVFTCSILTEISDAWPVKSGPEFFWNMQKN